jgi:hypothetical protein
MEDDDVFAAPPEQSTLSALGFTQVSEDHKLPEAPRKASPAEVQCGSGVHSGMNFGLRSSYDYDRDSREFCNRSPEDSGFGDERLERISSPKSREDENTKWSYDLKDLTLSPNGLKEEETTVSNFEENVFSSPANVQTEDDIKPQVKLVHSEKEIVEEDSSIVPRVHQQGESQSGESTHPTFMVKKIGRVPGPRGFIPSHSSTALSPSDEVGYRFVFS